MEVPSQEISIADLSATGGERSRSIRHPVSRRITTSENGCQSGWHRLRREHCGQKRDPRNQSKTMKVLARWPLAPCEEPSGLAIDKESHRLFSVCSNQK